MQVSPTSDAGTGVSAPVPVSYRYEFNPDQVEEALSHVRASLERDTPQWTPDHEATKCSDPEHRVCIVGGGPSLADTLDELRAISEEPGSRIVALNDAAWYLHERGIPVWAECFLEIAKWDVGFLERRVPGALVLLSSSSHPSTYDKLGDANILEWHACEDIGEADLIRAKYPDVPLVNGGTSASTRVMFLLHASGWHRFDLFGMDSSSGDTTHAYEERPSSRKNEMEVTVAGRTFSAPGYLVRQAEDYRLMWTNLRKEFSGTRVHGDGLVPHMAKLFGLHASQAGS